MLSGVASDEEVKALAERFSTGELVRMMNLIQDTVAGFTRSESRRLDAEMCIMNMCQPELDGDISAVIARLTRIEDQIRSGSFAVAAPAAVTEALKAEQEAPAEPVQEDVPAAAMVVDEAPVGFWTEVASGVRKELPPAVAGFFITTPNAPLKGVLSGEKLLIVCKTRFVMDIVNNQDILGKVRQKASAMAGRPLRIVVTDETMQETHTEQLEQLLQFGREHSDVINIKDAD